MNSAGEQKITCNNSQMEFYNECETLWCLFIHNFFVFLKRGYIASFAFDSKTVKCKTQNFFPSFIKLALIFSQEH